MMLSGSQPLLAEFFLINQNGVKCFFFSCIYQYVLFQLYGTSTEQYLNVSIILPINILFYS